MTDEERKQLIISLRWLGHLDYEPEIAQPCLKAAEEIERLANERDQLVEQLAIRSETGMAKDMQEIMRINNKLSERLALAQSDAEPVAWLIHDPSGFKFASVDKSGAHEYCGKRPAYRIEPLYTAPHRSDASDPRYEISEVEGRFYIQRAGTDTVVAEFTDPPRPDAAAELAELRERSLENNRLAFQWIERHDKVCGYIAKNYPSVMLPHFPFPSPVSRHDASAGLLEAEEVMKTAELYAGRLHACLLGAGFEPPHQEWLAAHFRDAITAAIAQSDPLPREHQDPSKWPTRETVERAHALARTTRI
jgi:hypothetical protein